MAWEFKDIVTAAAAGVGAVTGVWNLLKQYTDNHDKIKVAFNRRLDVPALVLTVENRSRHLVTLADYGFVLADGQLLSIPSAIEIGAFTPLENLAYYSTAGQRYEMEPFTLFRLEFDLLRVTAIGAWARAHGQHSPRVDFATSVERLHAWKIRLRELVRHRPTT